MSEIDLESVLTAMVRKVNGTDPAEVEPARFPPGTRNALVDVPGVLVGHRDGGRRRWRVSPSWTATDRSWGGAGCGSTCAIRRSWLRASPA